MENKLRSVRHWGFEATRLYPAATPDGTSLSEQMDEWIGANASDRVYIATEYQMDGTNHYALVIFAEE